MASEPLITETNRAALSATLSVGQLSFTGRRADGGINLWSPDEVPDDWGEQCRLGREYGREAVDYIRETHSAAVLPGIVRTIAERDTFGGVEVGFFTALSVAVANV